MIIKTNNHCYVKSCTIAAVLLLILLPINSSGYCNLNKTSNTIRMNILADKSIDFNSDWYTKPNSYAELVSWYKALENDYPDYLEVFKANELYGAGTVAGGYDIYYIRITNESLGFHKPEVLFLGSPHGDETVGTIGLYWFTDWLMRMAFTEEPCQDYSKDWLCWLIDNREIYITVSQNPYGFDHNYRFDYNDWDLNREADYDGPGSPTGGIWGSVNGRTLSAFINDHLIRVGCDFHGGVRMLLYPWSSNHDTVIGTSPISGKSYSHAPPDFYFFDVSSLRLGDYMGDYGGNLMKNNIGTIPDMISYEAQGGICPWAYGSDVFKNPSEDPYVEGNYPGSGVLWVSPEMSLNKNPQEFAFGNDTVHKYGAEVRRFVLHQTDLAQPYIRWQAGTPKNDALIPEGINIIFRWQVNGSLVVDHTYIQWGANNDPINHSEFSTPDFDEYAESYMGGTGWDNAMNGHTNGVFYEENIQIDGPGDYYFVAKAKVDQIYDNVLQPEIYGDTPYLRLVKERTDESYYEVIAGSDGIEEINGKLWWYSSVIHITIYENDPPEKPNIPFGQINGALGNDYAYDTISNDPDGDLIYYWFDWGDVTNSGWVGPYVSGAVGSASHVWTALGIHTVKVKAKDSGGAESKWSDPLIVVIEDTDNPKVEITKPEKALYLNNRKVLPFFVTFVIGSIDIEVTVIDSGIIDRVEFYIDNELKTIDDSEPYVWRWSECEQRKFIHKINVVAYDSTGKQTSEEISVIRLL